MASPRWGGDSPPWVIRTGSCDFTPSWARAASASVRRPCPSLLAPWHSDILRITSNLGAGFATGTGTGSDPVSAFSVCEPARGFYKSNRSGLRNPLTFSPRPGASLLADGPPPSDQGGLCLPGPSLRFHQTGGPSCHLSVLPLKGGRACGPAEARQQCPLPEHTHRRFLASHLAEFFDSHSLAGLAGPCPLLPTSDPLSYTPSLTPQQ